MAEQTAQTSGVALPTIRPSTAWIYGSLGFPIAMLGYPPRRVEELTTTAVVGMIDKYEEFWMPHLLKPGVGGPQTQ